MLVAFNPETGTTSQGRTVEQALANLKEATELYLEEKDLPDRSPAFLTTFDVAHAKLPCVPARRSPRRWNGSASSGGGKREAIS